MLALLLALLWVVAPAQGLPTTRCISDVVCVVTEQTETGVVFAVRNLQPEPLLVTIEASLRGLETDVPLPHVATYPPGTHRAFVARPQGSSPQWTYSYRFTYRPAHKVERYCHASYFCVVQEQRLDTLRFYVENRGAGTLSAQFDMVPGNIRMATRFPHTAAFPAGERTLAFEGIIQPGADHWDSSYRARWAFGDVTKTPEHTFAYALPYARGTSHTVVQGYNGDYSHQGTFALDFDLPRGTPVTAARDGVVVAVEERYDDGKPNEAYRSKANYVKVLHQDGTVAQYVHLERGGALVEVGQPVRQGQVLGTSGNSGYSAGPHLHFEVLRLDRNINHKSIPVRFRVDNQIVELRTGERYTAR